MENNEVSTHEVRVVAAVRNKGGWMTSREIASAAKVSDRTARHHALRLVKLGIFDQAEVFPGHRYRFADKADKRNAAYMNRLAAAADALGEPSLT